MNNTMRRPVSGRVSAAILALAVGACAHGGGRQASPVNPPTHPQPDMGGVLFWKPEQQMANYPHMERVYPTRTVKRGDHVSPLPKAASELKTSWTLDGESWDTETYLARNHGVGLLVIKDGRIALEKYAGGLGPDSRWTSFSVAKSFSSTLAGAAVKDGYIGNVDDPVVKYLPGLKGSGYDAVSVRQLLQMTSGVKWNESYTDPNSDVSRFGSEPSVNGSDPVVTYMARLPSEAAPGTKWVYKTGETNLVGSLVRAATGKTLADYLSEKVWKPVGMEQDANWQVDASGGEIAGCCLSATLKDYGRMGLFVLNGAKVNGKSILPDDWMKQATTSADAAKGKTPLPGGYGYQWWLTEGAAFRGQGIFGQQMWINPDLKLVIISWSAWPAAQDQLAGRRRSAMVAAVEAAYAAK